MHQPDDTQHKKDESKDDDETFHTPHPIIIAAACLTSGGEHTPAPAWRGDVLSGLQNRSLRTAGCGCGFLGGLGCGGGLAAPLGFRRCGRRFANQFGRHDARYKQLGSVIVKIHGSALLVGSGHGPKLFVTSIMTAELIGEAPATPPKTKRRRKASTAAKAAKAAKKAAAASHA